MMATRELTAARVHEIFMECYLRSGEKKADSVEAQGINTVVPFHRARVRRHRQEIHDFLAELSDSYKVGGGGGYGFASACLDRHGNQWADSQLSIEQLVQLGIAIGEVEYCLPLAAWSAFHDGLPYFVVKQ